MTSTKVNALVDPMDRPHVLRPSADDPVLWTREREVQLAIIKLDAGLCASRMIGPPREGDRAAYCGKQLAWLWVAWDHRITKGFSRDDKPWVLGEDAFQVHRHADGTPCRWAYGIDTEEGRWSIDLYAQPTCPRCGSHRDAIYKQLAYHDRTTCRDCGLVIDGPDIGD